MTIDESRRELVALTEACRYQTEQARHVTKIYVRSMGTPDADEMQTIYLDWGAQLSELASQLRTLAAELSGEAGAKLYEAAALIGHGQENDQRALSLLASATAIVENVQNGNSEATTTPPVAAPATEEVAEPKTAAPKRRTTWRAVRDALDKWYCEPETDDQKLEFLDTWKRAKEGKVDATGNAYPPLELAQLSQLLRDRRKNRVTLGRE